MNSNKTAKQSGVTSSLTGIFGAHGPTPASSHQPGLGLHFPCLCWPTQFTDLYPTDHVLEPEPISSFQSALFMSAVAQMPSVKHRAVVRYFYWLQLFLFLFSMAQICVIWGKQVFFFLSVNYFAHT